MGLPSLPKRLLTSFAFEVKAFVSWKKKKKKREKKKQKRKEKEKTKTKTDSSFKGLISTLSSSPFRKKTPKEGKKKRKIPSFPQLCFCIISDCSLIVLFPLIVL